MRILGLDTETTGFDPTEHRFVQFYGEAWGLSPRSFETAYETLINPERSIPAEAQRVHHITPADVAGAPRWISVAPKIHGMMNYADFIVAQNGEDFDLPFLNAEFKRIGLDPIDKPIVDTMKQGRFATPYGKLPTLGELCFALDVPYDTKLAHKADYDVRVMMDCFFKGLDWGLFQIPSTAGSLT